MQTKMRYIRKCPKIDIKIDKSILRIEISQNFEVLLFISAQITPRSKLSGFIGLIFADISDWSQTKKKLHTTILK